MKNTLSNKRIPTIFGIGLIVLGIALTTVIVRIQTGFRSSAGSSQEPQNVKITNLSDSSFTITYQTDAAVTGSVNYGESKELGNIQLEDTDKEKSDLSSKNIHSITVEKLSPDTEYYLAIISDQNTFLNKKNPFKILTAPSIASPSASNAVVRGKVVLPDGNPPSEALVYLNTKNSQALSSVVKENGEFNFSLKGFRTNDLASHLKINENTIFKLSVISNSLKSTVLFEGLETNSIPTITLSNDYDFTKDFVEIASKSAQPGFPSTTTESKNIKPRILTPKKDQSFTDRKPQFQGTSLPNEKVEIIIHSDENIQAQVTADRNGNWIYRPAADLSLGTHTITIKTRDSSGILTTIMQSFTVLATDSQTAETTVPSVSPTQKITPTSTPIFIPTPLPSPRINTILTPIPTPIVNNTKGGLPPTGNSSILLIIGGVVSTISGIALLLLTRTMP